MLLEISQNIDVNAHENFQFRANLCQHLVVEWSNY